MIDEDTAREGRALILTALMEVLEDALDGSMLKTTPATTEERRSQDLEHLARDLSVLAAAYAVFSGPRGS